MKRKTRLVIIPLLLLMAVGFVGCGDTDDSMTTDEQVEAFFKKASNDLIGGRVSFFPDRTWNADVSPLIINSDKDFHSAYYGKEQLPTIDFSRYTLIIGALYVPADNYVKKQELIRNGVDATLNLYLEISDQATTCDFNHELYWGIYPKLSIRNIYVKKYRNGKEWNL